VYVYLKTESHLFTVGFYSPDGRFQSEGDHNTAEAAAARVHYLNGGIAHHGTMIEYYTP
jgi:hypothetical protein